MVGTITETYSYADHIFPNKKVESIPSKFSGVCVREREREGKREGERGGEGGRELTIFAF